jgi:hypothetical protein
MALFPEVDGIIEFSFFPYGFERVSNALSTKFEDGHKAVRAGFSEQVRRGVLTCRNLPEVDKDRITAFFREIKGGGSIFQLIDRVNNIVPPYFAPALNTTPGGALGSRTYYVLTSFSNLDRSKETAPTQVGETSLLVGATLALTAKMPDIPPGATLANLYVGTSPGTLYYAGSTQISLYLWTQGFGTTNINSDCGVGTDILFVITTAGFQIGDPIGIDIGGGLQEWHIIKDLLTTPTRIQIEGLLGFTHTLIGADPVAVVTDNSNFSSPPSSGDFKGEEINVALMNEWDPQLDTAGVWEGSVEIEEQLP